MFRVALTVTAAAVVLSSNSASAATVASFSADVFFNVNWRSAKFEGTDIDAWDHLVSGCYADCADTGMYREGNAELSFDGQLSGREVDARYSIVGTARNAAEEAYAYWANYELPGYFYGYASCDPGDPCASDPSIEVTIDYLLEASARTSLLGRAREASASAESAMFFQAEVLDGMGDFGGRVEVSETLNVGAESSKRNRFVDTAEKVSGSYTAILRPVHGLGLSLYSNHLKG